MACCSFCCCCSCGCGCCTSRRDRSHCSDYITRPAHKRPPTEIDKIPHNLANIPTSLIAKNSHPAANLPLDMPQDPLAPTFPLVESKNLKNSLHHFFDVFELGFGGGGVTRVMGYEGLDFLVLVILIIVIVIVLRLRLRLRRD